MAVTPGLCTQAKLVWLKSMAQDEFWVALYGPEASLGPGTAAYTPEGEVVGLGYERGGLRLSGLAFGVTGTRAWMDWDDPRWPVSSIRVAAALIYNRSRNNLAICVLAFDGTIASVNGPWWLEMPPPGDTAVIRWA